VIGILQLLQLKEPVKDTEELQELEDAYHVNN